MYMLVQSQARNNLSQSHHVSQLVNVSVLFFPTLSPLRGVSVINFRFCSACSSSFGSHPFLHHTRGTGFRTSYSSTFFFSSPFGICTRPFLFSISSPMVGPKCPCTRAIFCLYFQEIVPRHCTLSTNLSLHAPRITTIHHTQHHRHDTFVYLFYLHPPHSTIATGLLATEPRL